MINITFIIGGALISIVLTALMWKPLLKWGYQAVLPWIRLAIPSFAHAAETAFVLLDKLDTYGRDIIDRVVKTWRALRTRLLEQKVTIERRSEGQYYRIIEQWLYAPEKQEAPYIRQVSEEVIDWQEIPWDFKEKIVNASQAIVNLTEERDAQVLTYEQAT